MQGVEGERSVNSVLASDSTEHMLYREMSLGIFWQSLNSKEFGWRLVIVKVVSIFWSLIGGIVRYSPKSSAKA